MYVKQYISRRLVVSNSKVKSYGITIPPEIITRFGEGTLFKIEVSGTGFIATSGASLIPTKKAVDEFDLEELKV